MSTYMGIEQLQSETENAQRAYLKRHGWTETCNTPGSYWLWRRDFSDVDTMRAAIVVERKLPSKHIPYGVITAPIELAVRMTRAELDHAEGEGEGDD